MSRKKLQTANIYNRLKELINKFSGGNVTEFAKKTGIKQATLHNYTKGRLPNAESLYNICNNLDVNLNWLIAGEGEMIRRDEKDPLYNKEEIPGMYVADPDEEYSADTNSFAKAVSGLKEIFDSGDPVLVPTARAGIHAFQISVRREKQINKQNKKVDDLENKCADLIERIKALESHLMDVDRRKQVRRQEDLGPPEGLEERRSGQERRQQGVVITTIPMNNKK